MRARHDPERGDAPVTTPPRPGRANPWAALLVLCLGNFLILLDTSIVNTAVPDMMRSLDTGIDSMLWVLNGYLLALASLLIVAGRLGDLFGPRTVFMAGMAVFAVASVLCGAAQSPEQLIAARVAQGVGAAALLPQALVLISGIFPAARRGAAFGIFTAVAGMAAVSGPTLGGLVITRLGWEWIFYLNVPLSVAGVALAWWLVPDLRTRRPRHLDVVGVLLATAALVGLMYALIEGERHDWGTMRGPVSIPAILGLAAVCGVVFALRERRQREPLVPPGLFRLGNFGPATLITLVSSFGLYGFLLVFVIETQALLGMSPLESGLAALPWTVVLSAVAPVAGRLTDRLGGRRLLAGGLTVYALGVLGMALLVTPRSTAGTFVVPLIAVGIGMGASIAPTTTEAMRDVPARLAGAAAGVLNTARQVGGALGAAVVGAVLQHRLADTLPEAARAGAAQLPPEARADFLGGFGGEGVKLGAGQAGGFAVPAGTPPELADRYRDVAAGAFADAFLPAVRPALGVVVGVLLLGGLFALRLRGRPARAEADPSADAAPSPDGGPGREAPETVGPGREGRSRSAQWEKTPTTAPADD
ncbi:DHA2 family efflux MFS transporter permease subunit [Micromonospora sp. NPDC048170]|uniref:DHA2 family efflux MFS transporter permease subunit n=1 Tax=Micromonospora sp. NPDC048170 TaxID=3154819 RepID=UPI0033D81160